MKAGRLSSLVLVVLAVILPLRICPAQAPKLDHKTAAVNLLPSKLISVDFTQQGKPLPEALNQIAQAGGLAIIIDESVPSGRIVAGSLKNISASRALQIICEGTKQVLRQVGDTYIITASPTLPIAGESTPTSRRDPYSMMSRSPVELSARDLSLRDAVRQLVDQVPSPRYLLDFERTVPAGQRVPNMVIAHQPFAQVMWMLLEPAGLMATVEEPVVAGAATVIHIRAKTRVVTGVTLPPPGPYSDYSKLSSAPVELNAQDLPLQDMLRKMADQAGAGKYVLDIRPEVPSDLRVLRARIHAEPFNRALKMLLDQAGLIAWVDAAPAPAGTAQVIHITPKPRVIVIGPGTWPWVPIRAPGGSGYFPPIFSQIAISDHIKAREITRARLAEWQQQKVIALKTARDGQRTPEPKKDPKALPVPKT